MRLMLMLVLVTDCVFCSQIKIRQNDPIVSVTDVFLLLVRLESTPLGKTSITFKIVA